MPKKPPNPNIYIYKINELFLDLFVLMYINYSSPSSSGATSAPSLIFILPGVFYVRIVPQEQEPLMSRPKIQVQLSSFCCC